MTLSRVPFSDVVRDVTAGNVKIAQSDFLSSGQLAVVDQGKSLVAGFTDEVGAAVRTAGPLIVFGDHTRALKFVDFPFAMGADGTKVLQVRDGVHPRYVYWYLHSLQIPSAGYSRHFKFLKEVTVPVPSMGDQRRIAAILDHADALRAKRRQVLTHLDALTQSIFHDMFGKHEWPETTLDEVSTIAGEYGANVPSVGPIPGLPRYVRITDITSAGGLRSDARSPGGSAADWERYWLADGDLLFARSGATVGKTYRHRVENGKCVFAGYLIRYRPDQTRALPDYLFAFTHTDRYRAWVSARQNVVAQPNINAKQYGGELSLPLPPLDLQQDFVRKIEVVRDQQLRMVREQAALDELFASLQSRAFKGEL